MFLFRPRRYVYVKTQAQEEKENFILRNIIIFILSCGVFYFNTSYLTRRYVLNKVRAQVVTIPGDSYVPKFNDQFVYFNTNHTRFPTITDEEFDIGRTCGRLKRSVQYCQWQEFTTTHSHKEGNNTVTEVRYHYHKGWVDHQINSFFFNNPMYNNPTVETVPQIEYTKDFNAGSYVISKELPVSGSYSKLVPDNGQVLSFTNSFQGRKFRYAGRSIFYREYERGFLEKVLNVATFFDVDNCDHFDWCTPGDTRVWFSYWAPNSLSVIGKKEENVIVPTTYEGYDIGNAASGYVSVKDILYRNTMTGYPFVIFNVLMIIAIIYNWFAHKDQYLLICAYVGVILSTLLPFMYKSSLREFGPRIVFTLIAGVVTTFFFYNDNCEGDTRETYHSKKSY